MWGKRVAQIQKNSRIREKLNLSACADNNTDAKEIPEHTETDKNGQKCTATKIIIQKRTERDKNGQKQRETE